MPVHRHPVAAPTSRDSLAGLPLDHELIGRLQASFAQVRAHGLRLGEIFYGKLFAAAPDLRALFRNDLRAQTEKLIAALDAIVDNLASPEQNAGMIAALGRRHAAYGARPEHYQLVTVLLIESMREVLGDRAEQRCLEEWRTAIRLVSHQMITAAAASGRTCSE